MPTDKEMMDFLESLMGRKRKISGREIRLTTDIHVRGFDASLYARTGIGSGIKFSGGGLTVRECIAKAMENSKV